jgi:hypothetical protein
MPKATRKNSTKSEAATRKHEALRDSLPFFKKGRRGKGESSWWTVKPSGDYAADLETGMTYAKAFLPMMMYNAGASDLGIIVSHMALAGRKSRKPTQHRGIDNIALGFLFGIGGSLQAAMGGVVIAASAIKRPEGTLGPDFLKLVEAGHVFNPLRRNSLFHDPSASIFGRQPGRSSKARERA